jgi:hypothetical protein
VLGPRGRAATGGAALISDERVCGSSRGQRRGGVFFFPHVSLLIGGFHLFFLLRVFKYHHIKHSINFIDLKSIAYPKPKKIIMVLIVVHFMWASCWLHGAKRILSSFMSLTRTTSFAGCPPPLTVLRPRLPRRGCLLLPRRSSRAPWAASVTVLARAAREAPLVASMCCSFNAA